MRDVTFVVIIDVITEQFLLTHPMRDVTIHSTGQGEWLAFLLTHPMRDVTNFTEWYTEEKEFLLTHPMRDVTTVQFLG